MMTDGKQDGAPQEEGDDALWRLLERSRQPRAVSPYFSRRVLREVALLEEAQPAADSVPNWLARTWLAWRREPRWAFAGALAAVALLTVGGVGLSSLRRPSPLVPVAVLPPASAAPVVPEVESTILPDAVAEIDPSLQRNGALSPDPVVTAQDVEVIADLDNLLSREESRLWTEDDTARF